LLTQNLPQPSQNTGFELSDEIGHDAEFVCHIGCSDFVYGDSPENLPRSVFELTANDLQTSLVQCCQFSFQ